ncbi:MAG: signal peptidase II [Methyloligellaceae bacterium]
MTAAPNRWLWGPSSRLGFALALLALIADQTHKWWMLHVYRIQEKGSVAVAPFLDLVMVWNKGISYGLFAQDSRAGQAALIGFACVAVVVLAVWLARTHSALAAAAIGLIIGGAIGNAIDRYVYGAVADFFSFHAFGHHWYVFNIADAAIVAGVIGLVYDTLFHSHKKVSKAS